MSMIASLPIASAPTLPVTYGAVQDAPAQAAAPAAAPLAAPPLFAQFLGLDAAPDGGIAIPSEGSADDTGADAPSAAAGQPPAAAAADTSLPAMAAPMVVPLQLPLPLPLPAAPFTSPASFAAPVSSASPAPSAQPAAVRAGAAVGTAPVATDLTAPTAGAPLPAPAAAAARQQPAGTPSAAPAIPAPLPQLTATTGAAAAAAPAASGDVNATANTSAKRDAAPAASGETPATPAAGAASWGIAAPAAAPAPASGNTVRLEGAPQQWQQPLREALGERLQTQVGRNAEHALIRLDPPQLGRIEIAISHNAGALQVHLSASHGEVLRQLHEIGDGMRQQLSRQAYTEVAVTVAATPRGAAGQPFGDGGGRQRHPGRQGEDAEPGRALTDAGPSSATFAMQPELE